MLVYRSVYIQKDALSTTMNGIGAPPNLIHSLLQGWTAKQPIHKSEIQNDQFHWKKKPNDIALI